MSNTKPNSPDTTNFKANWNNSKQIELGPQGPGSYAHS